MIYWALIMPRILIYRAFDHVPQYDYTCFMKYFGYSMRYVSGFCKLGFSLSKQQNLPSTPFTFVTTDCPKSS
jgi:hypothetical protein